MTVKVICGKVGQAHPDHHLPKNKGTGVAIDDAFIMIDIQAQHQ